MLVKEMSELLNFPSKKGGVVCQGDPILSAIESFRAGLEDYNKNAPTDSDIEANSYAEISYRGPLRVIQEWKMPAQSSDGAIAALRLAVQADQDGDYSLVGPMVAAALSYFERQYGVD